MRNLIFTHSAELSSAATDSYRKTLHDFPASALALCNIGKLVLSLGLKCSLCDFYRIFEDKEYCI